MIFYHGTSEENWKLIQQEGILWGKHGWDGKSESYRYTYLTPNIEVAKNFSSGVLLEVEYTPKGNIGMPIELIEDNYAFACPPDTVYEEGMYCWQFSVFVPISIINIKRIFYDE